MALILRLSEDQGVTITVGEVEFRIFVAEIRSIKSVEIGFDADRKTVQIVRDLDKDRNEPKRGGLDL